MRKFYYCSLLLTLLAFHVSGQVFYKVTHLAGTANIAGNLVTVHHVGWVANEYSACKTGPYRISNYKKKDTGEDTCRAYVFAFTNPVHKVRARLTNVNKGEEISFYVNGNFYTLHNNDLYPYGGNCVGLPVSSVMNGRVGTDSSNSNAMVLIDPGFPIDSVMVYYDKNDDAGIHFSFEFESDPKISILQPYVDTLKCTGDSLSVNFKSTALFSDGNVFTAELSDKNGGFSSPTVIGTLADTNIIGMIRCKLPDNIESGAGYRIRVSTTGPIRISNDNGSNIRITEFPKLELSSNSPVCEGQDIIFKSNDLSNAIYFWAGPGGFNTTTSSPVVKRASSDHSGRYIVSVIHYSCKTVDTTYVAIKPVPHLLSATAKTPLCEGDSLSLSARSRNSADTFYWSGPLDFRATTPTPMLRNIVASQSGTYAVTAYNNGCFSDTLKVDAHIKPKPAIPQLTTNAPVYPGDELNFTATSSTPGITYRWTGPAGFTSTELNPTIPSPSVESGGDYTFTVELDGCTSSATILARILTKNLFTMFPNPNDGNFNLKLNVIENGDVPIEILNDRGQTVYRELNKTVNNLLEKKVTINTKLPEGMYIMRITIGKETKSIKIRIAY